jgi:hypothetical protein
MSELRGSAAALALRATIRTRPYCAASAHAACSAPGNRVEAGRRTTETELFLFITPWVLADDELARLEDRLLQMSSQAQDALDRAVQAVLARDAAAAERVITEDRAIDALEIEIEEMVTNLLALHQPMARGWCWVPLGPR